MTAPLRAVLWDPTFTTQLGEFGSVRSTTGQKQLSDIGWGRVSVPLDDPAVALLTVPADDDLEDAQIVQVLQRRSPAGEWAPIFAGVVETWKIVEVDPRGGPGRQVDMSLVGWPIRLRKAKIRPAGGISSSSFDDWRRFDWTAPELDTSGWAAAYERAEVGDATVGPPDGQYGAPGTFPRRPTRWIAPSAAGGTNDDVGKMWVAGEYELEADTNVWHYVTADDLFVLARNGVPLTGFVDPSSFATFQTFARGGDEPAGPHQVRAEVTNRAQASPTGNAHLFAWVAAGRTVEPTGEVLEDTIAATGLSAFRFTTDPDDVRFEWGRMFIALLTEAQANGELTGVTVSFDEQVDSDGTPWEKGTFVWSPDDSLLDVLRRSAEAGWCEWSFDLDQLRLVATVAGGAGSDLSDEYQFPADATDPSVLQLEHSIDTGQRVTKLHVRDATGWFTVGSGQLVDTLRLQQVQDRDEAQRQATAYLDTVGSVVETTTLKVLPTSPELVPQPYETFWDGDYIGAPLRAGFGAARVCSLTWELRGGHVAWTLELLNRRRDAVERMARIARRTGAGSMGGRVDSFAPATPLQPAGVTVTQTAPTWSQYGNASAVTSGAAVVAFDAPTRVMAVRVRASGPADPATTGATSATVDLGGVTLGTATLADGETLGVLDIDPVIAQVGQVLTVSDVTPGNHAGVSVEVVCAPLPQ